MALNIVIKNTGNPDRSLSLEKTFVSIGADPACDVFLPSLGMAGEVANLRVKNGQLYLFSTGAADLTCNSRSIPKAQSVQISDSSSIVLPAGLSIEVSQGKPTFPVTGANRTLTTEPSSAQRDEVTADPKPNPAKPGIPAYQLVSLGVLFLLVLGLVGMVFLEPFASAPPPNFLQRRKTFFQFSQETLKSQNLPLIAKQLLLDVLEADQDAAGGNPILAQDRFQAILYRLQEKGLINELENDKSLDKDFSRKLREYVSYRLKMLSKSKNKDPKGTSFF